MIKCYSLCICFLSQTSMTLKRLKFCHLDSYPLVTWGWWQGTFLNLFGCPIEEQALTKEEYTAIWESHPLLPNMYLWKECTRNNEARLSARSVKSPLAFKRVTDDIDHKEGRKYETYWTSIKVTWFIGYLSCHWVIIFINSSLLYKMLVLFWLR